MKKRGLGQDETEFELEQQTGMNWYLCDVMISKDCSKIKKILQSEKGEYKEVICPNR